MPDVTMTRTQYDNLIAAANLGDEAAIKSLQAEIDVDNSIIRYAVVVRWTDLGGRAVPVPIPQVWPPELTGTLTKQSVISKENVEEFVDSRTDGTPQNIHVTSDPDGNAGWTLLDDYDFVANAS